MIKKCIICLFIAIFCLMQPCLAQTESGTGQNWSSGSAYLLPVGRMEIGLFQSLRYGWSNRLEFSTHPLLNFLMPNLNLKWSHHFYKPFTIATQHSFYYPTPLLRTISREGTGGIISPEFTIPHMVAFYNEILVSTFLNKDFLLTAKAGFVFALKSGKLDDRTTIDLPMVFPRLAVFYHDYGFRFGGDLGGKFYRRWHLSLDFDIFLTPDADENFAFENKGLILWNKSTRFQLCFGYKLVYGKYPFGTQWHLLAPIFDFQWARQMK